MVLKFEFYTPDKLAGILRRWLSDERQQKREAFTALARFPQFKFVRGCLANPVGEPRRRRTTYISIQQVIILPIGFHFLFLADRR
jgi:hypothetical protein